MPRTEKDVANLDMIARMIAAAGRTCAGYDPDQLARLAGLHRAVDDAIADAIAGQRAQGVTWKSIGEGLGITKEGAIITWGPRVANL